MQAYSDKENHFEKLYNRVLEDIHKQASPGSCQLARFGSVNATVLGYEDGFYDEQRYYLVKGIVKERFLNYTRSDPIKLFIKCEPIKKSKYVEERFRLISSVSLEDNFIDRLLFSTIFNKFLKNFIKTGLCVGYSPLKGGHFLINLMFPQHKPTLMIDKKAFDWTVHVQLLHLVKEFLVGLFINPPMWWLDMVNARFEHLFENPEFVFSDGTRLKQPVKGVMKSGCYLTTLINSILQILLHYIACMRCGKKPTDDILSLGDDTVQELMDFLEQYLDALRSLGVIPKHYTSNFPSFAGFDYKYFSFTPEYRQKHLFALLHLEQDKEIAGSTLSSYLVIYWNDPPMKSYIRSILLLRDLTSYDIPDVQLRAFNMARITGLY